MIYIGKFLHATDQQRNQEENRRHGEFNLIIEAENEKAALEKFRQRIAELLRRTGRVTNYETALLTKDGEVRNVLLTLWGL